MSTDTMYFNSSRLLPSAGRNKTNNLIKQKTRNNRARGNAAKNANNNNYITDIPPPQTLPNGQKPNFGHSSHKKPSFNQKKHSPPSSLPLQLLQVKKTDRIIKKLHDRTTKMILVY
ncbi:ALI_collapsed_G0021010.mRNA.1.CDS.1 [Saccharomyces cerevisiae]|nr:ALI_collapsed_G0021010.mRNA.1.CDS.1 [Saccharomyces cerevisiae]